MNLCWKCREMNRTRRENAVRTVRYCLAQAHLRLVCWLTKHLYSVQRWGGQHPASARRNVMYDRCMCDEPEEEDAEAGMWSHEPWKPGHWDITERNRDGSIEHDCSEGTGCKHFTYDTERQDVPDGPPPLPEDWLRLREANTSQITRDPPGIVGASTASYEEWMKKLVGKPGHCGDAPQ